LPRSHRVFRFMSAVENREFLEIIYGAVDQCQCAWAERGHKNNGRQPPWGAAIPGRKRPRWGAAIPEGKPGILATRLLGSV